MRDYAKNRPESHNKKISEANKNRKRKVSDETKLKISAVRRKLTDEDIENIIELLKTKTQVEIAKMYNISAKHVSRINCGWTPKQITSNCI
jgi:DNA-directed RNA polymerase specialized sigma subunit